ncbi:putative membrane protein [Lachnospiraceae bacterium TWA4]|nr:putative membrane protein [Lachnospiraceae bacterium TWA4]
MENYIEYLYALPAVLIAIVLHEYAHGFVSYKLGDPTPKSDGRLSLIPSTI